MPYRNKLVRLAILALAIVGLAAASAAAARWTPWSPLNSCLFCGTPDAKGPVAVAVAERGNARTTGSRTSGVGHATAGSIADRSPSMLPPALTGAVADAAPAADGSRHEWQPWGTGSAFRGAGGAEGSGVMGGLSRLMSISISGGGSAVRVPETPAPSGLVARAADKLEPATPTPPAVNPPAASPGPAPAPAPLPPGPGGYVPPTPTPGPGPTAGGPDPTDPFHEHDTSPPPPFVPPPPAGPMDPNDPGGTRPTGGDSPSPNPEPGSILLLGTGVVAVFGELRRRRVL